MSQVDHLLDQGKSYFQAKKYEACMGVVNQVLSENPENTEAVWLMKEAQRQWEDQRSIEELEIYVENLKKEAMDLFDKEHYERCLGMFRFLSELEPENRTLQDYLQLSQRMFLETIGTESSASEAGRTRLAEMMINQGKDPVEPGAVPMSPVPVVSELPATGVEFAGFTGTVQEIENSQTLPLGSRQEFLPDVETQGIVENSSTSTAHPGRRRSRVGWLSAFGLLLLTLLAVRLWLYPWLMLNKSVDIQSNPTGASVFLNNALKGQTPFHLEHLPAGTYSLRVEKDGYLPYGQSLVVGGAQTVLILLQLEKITVAAEPVMEIAAAVAVEPQVELQKEEPAAAAVAVPPASESVVEAPISYSVIHHHVLGSCTGRIKVEGDTISFHPAGDSRDGFTRKIKQIDTTDLSDKLTIEFKNRTYRFETLAGTRQENHQRLADLYERIKRQWVTAKR